MNRPTLFPSLHGLDVISNSFHTEYRYYANQPLRGEQTHYLHRYAYLDALFVGLIAYFWYQSLGSRWHLFATISILLSYTYWRCSRVVYESAIVFPLHGVQLETHRGPFNSLFVSRRFIPSIYIQDVIINEALHRWNVRYYLAIIVRAPRENLELAVAFENTLPHFPVLLEVYRGVIETLYKE